MSDIAIKVENVGKLYRLGEVGTGTLSQDLKRWWAKTRGKEDPFALVGETNDRTSKGNSEFVWALKDISFEVKEGEVLGIIGRNGAGKSTLLKLLSKVTQPTTGDIKVKGRIASLLEVGTGFHPDLTGRENVFLNGAILGMTKREVSNKFDEIVDFSGVERYIDTPVKRYSSGMYVRLAFAVAAFLEPEILIVDEVLAVGDIEFQKKCLGRMKDVSRNDGRTVLFVSHNMEAIRVLCASALMLEKSQIALIGDVEECISRYMLANKISEELINRVADYQLDQYTKVMLLSLDKEAYYPEEPAQLRLTIKSPSITALSALGVLIYNQADVRVGILDLRALPIVEYSEEHSTIDIVLNVHGFHLIPGTYKLGLFIHSKFSSGNFLDILNFKIKNLDKKYIKYPTSVQGYVQIPFEGEIITHGNV